MKLFQEIKNALQTAIIYVKLKNIFHDTAVTPKGEYLYKYCLSIKNNESPSTIESYEEAISKVIKECEVNRITAIELILSMFDYLRAKNL